MDEIEAYFKKKLEKGGANVLETFDNMDESLSLAQTARKRFADGIDQLMPKIRSHPKTKSRNFKLPNRRINNSNINVCLFNNLCLRSFC